jgi:hypothetical protein
MIQGLEFKVTDLRFRVAGLRSWVESSELLAQSVGRRV